MLNLVLQDNFLIIRDDFMHHTSSIKTFLHKITIILNKIKVFPITNINLNIIYKFYFCMISKRCTILPSDKFY